MTIQPSSILSQIGESVRIRLDRRKSQIPLDVIIGWASQARKPHDFYKFISSNSNKAPDRGQPKIIAEVKFRSPSQGALCGAPLDHQDEKPAVQIAGDYLRNGACALSVLTEEDHFSGSAEYLKKIRLAYPDTALLMKDFILEEYQIYEAFVRGADCILLIVALLGERRTSELFCLAKKLGIQALIEVHDEAEMNVAVSLQGPMIGINNRNLKTLQIDLDISRALVQRAPKDCLLVCESGIETVEQIQEMRALGFKAFLIGTRFMKTGMPGQALSQLLKGLG